MADKQIIRFPSYNVSVGEAIEIVRSRLGDPNIAMQSKVIAIERVSGMETHNSIKKEELVGAIRWIFEHYDLLSCL